MADLKKKPESRDVRSRGSVCLFSFVKDGLIDWWNHVDLFFVFLGELLIVLPVSVGVYRNYSFSSFRELVMMVLGVLGISVLVQIVIWSIMQLHRY